MEIINATDGYKLGHHRMYPEGTEQVYSNWTPRSNKYFPEATACVVNGELKEIFKHPKTDDGTKNSLKGLIAVYEGLDGKYTAIDQVSIEEEKDGYLETVFEDGILKKEYSLEEIRQRIDNGL